MKLQCFVHALFIKHRKQFFSIHKPGHPPHYWDSIKNHRKFFEKIAKQLNVKKWQDWYKISFADLVKLNASHLLNLYCMQTTTFLIIIANSHISALQTSFPEYNWQSWKFLHAPPGKQQKRVTKLGFWYESLNQRKFFDELSFKLNIKHFDEWYEIPVREIKRNGGSGLLLNSQF